MARVKGTIASQLSGTIGGLVFVQVGDKTYVRTAPNRKKNSWSKKQQQHRSRFQACTRFYQALRETVVIPIWNLSATKNLSGYNLFMKTNLPAFDAEGARIDPALLHFSMGTLPLPQHLSIVRDETSPTTVQISWSAELITRAEQPDDELLMMIRNDFQTFGPIETECLRKDESCRFDLSEWASESKWNLYLFFASADRTRYSTDQYFSV